VKRARTEDLAPAPPEAPKLASPAHGGGAEKAAEVKAPTAAEKNTAAMALLEEAIELAAHARPRRPASGPSEGIELRDDKGAPVLALRRAREAEIAGAGVDTRAISDLLGQLPQAALTALLAGSMANMVVMHVPAALAAQMAQGLGHMMSAAGGGFRGSIVSSVTSQVIGQVTLAPASAATLGAAALWQVVSIAVAQKHLHDISRRLDLIERDVREFREQLEQDLYAEILGDVGHLRPFQAKLRDREGGVLRAPEAEAAAHAVIRDARTRHLKLLDRLSAAGAKFTKDRRAKWFGQTMKTAAGDMKKDVSALGRLVLATRLNAVLFGAAVEVLRLAGADGALVEEIASDLSRTIEADDDVVRQAYERVRESVKALDAIFRGEASVAQERLTLAATVREGADLSARVRSALDLFVGRDVQGAELLVKVEDGKAVSAAWLVSEAVPAV
jgi:hypothetical protein